MDESGTVRERRIALIDALVRCGVTREDHITVIFDKVLEYCQAIAADAITNAIKEHEDNLLRRAQSGPVM